MQIKIFIKSENKYQCKKIEVNLYGAAKRASALELLWIGTADGPSSPQWYTTGNKAECLISQIIPNLIEMDIDGLSDKLKSLLKDFFYDMGEQQGSYKRYRYIMDFAKISSDLEKIDEIVENNEKDAKKVIKDSEKIINEYVKQQYDLKTSDITLYFLSIDGEPTAI